MDAYFYEWFMSIPNGTMTGHKILDDMLSDDNNMKTTTVSDGGKIESPTDLRVQPARDDIDDIVQTLGFQEASETAKCPIPAQDLDAALLPLLAPCKRNPGNKTFFEFCDACVFPVHEALKDLHAATAPAKLLSAQPTADLRTDIAALALHDACAEEAINYLWDNSERVQVNSDNFKKNVAQCMENRLLAPPCEDAEGLKKRIEPFKTPCAGAIHGLRSLTSLSDINAEGADGSPWAHLPDWQDDRKYCLDCYWPLLKEVTARLRQDGSKALTCLVRIDDAPGGRPVTEEDMLRAAKALNEDESVVGCMDDVRRSLLVTDQDSGNDVDRDPFHGELLPVFDHCWSAELIEAYLLWDCDA